MAPAALIPHQRPAAHANQCAMNTGTVMLSRICRDVPPRMNSRMREWPYTNERW